MIKDDFLSMKKFINLTLLCCRKILNYRYMNKPWTLALGLFIVVRVVGRGYKTEGFISEGSKYVWNLLALINFKSS